MHGIAPTNKCVPESGATMFLREETRRRVGIVTIAAALLGWNSAAQAKNEPAKGGSKTEVKVTSSASSSTKASSKTDKSESSSAPSKGKMEVWEVKQASKMVGAVSCLISKDAVRLRADKMGITWIFRAPKWEAYLYNTETKNYCSFPYEVWKDRAFFMPSGNKASKAKSELQQMKMSKSGKKQKIGGVECYELVISRQTGEKYGEIWMASDIPAPKQFSQMIGSLVMVPINKESGAPMKVAIFQAKAGKIVPALDTTSAVKTTVDSSTFDPMKGYNKVKDEMALLFAEAPDSNSPNSLFSGGNLTDGATPRRKSLP